MKQRKSKKALSVIIGYVLLIIFTITISIIVYKWLKTYVPQDEINCPGGTSLLIESYSYNCSSNMLTLNIVNNGKFDVGGYFIYGTDSPEKELATIDLSKANTDNNSIIPTTGIKFGGIVSEAKNSLEPNGRETEIYNLTTISLGQIYSIEIVPIRWQTEKRRMLLVSCKNSKIKKTIECE